MKAARKLLFVDEEEKVWAFNLTIIYFLFKKKYIYNLSKAFLFTSINKTTKWKKNVFHLSILSLTHTHQKKKEKV